MNNSQTISLNNSVCQKYGSSIGEIILLLIINNNIDLEEAEKNLISKGYITGANNNSLFENSSKWRVTNNGKALVDSVIIDSDKHQEPVDRLNSLASSLKEVFPKGKKEGTNYYWADGVALIVRRLKLFFKKYGNDFTDEQIINAATKYISSFNGNYKFMKLLKYFIFKEKLGVNGEVEGESELINYIENANQEDELKYDWTSTLR